MESNINPVSSLRIVAESPRSANAVRLIALLSAELAATYNSDGSAGFVPEDAEQAGGAFLVARADGVAIGCVALRPYASGTGEVKRMFVTKDWRGRKIGRLLLEAVEAAARECGYSRLLLETGYRQTEAITLYERSGYDRISAFGRYVHDPISVCFGKNLE